MRIVLRVNNDIHCNLAALVVVHNSTTDVPIPQFSRLAFIPGLSVAHPAIVWDDETAVFWMVSNINRDARRPWDEDAYVPGYAFLLSSRSLPTVESVL